MGFFGFGKARGIHSASAAERLQALGRLPTSEQRQFLKLAQGDSDAQVRLAAARRLREQALLESLLTHADTDIVAIARQGLAADAGRRIKTLSLAQGHKLLELVDDSGPLAEAVLHNQDPAMRSAAAQRLFALPQPGIQALLNIAIGDSSGTFAQQALPLLTTRSQLKQVIKRAASASVKAAAEAQLDDIREKAAQPSALQLRRQRRHDIAAMAEEAGVVALRHDWQEGSQRLGTLVEEAQAIYDAENDDEEILAAWQRIQRAQELFARRRSEAREAHEALQAFAEGQPDLQQSAQRAQRDELLAALASDDERQQWAARLPLPAAAPQAPVDQEPQAAISPKEEAPALEQVAIDDDALAQLEKEAEALLEWEDHRLAGQHFQKLHKQWMQVLAGTHKDDPRRQPFLDTWGQFKQQRREHREHRDAQQQERAQDMATVVAALEALVDQAAAEPARVQEERRALAARWKAIGNVAPRFLGDLRKRFRAAEAAIDDALASWYQERDWERFAQVPAAEELCGEAEALTAEGSALAGEELLQAVRNLQQRWKGLGQLPRSQNDALWGRFKAGVDAAFAALQPWFDQRDAERAGNVAERQHLIDKLTVVVEDDGVQGLTGSQADRDHERRRQEQVNELQQQWKEAGPVPREQRRDMDRAWKALLDRWYAGRRRQRAQEEAEQAENVPHKEAILQQLRDALRDAEAAQQGLLPGKTLDDVVQRLRQARRDWRSIGFVPKADLQRLREEWDSLNEKLEEACADRLAAEAEAEAANATAKEGICAELAQLLEEERPDWFRDEVGNLRRAWQEVGRVPRAQFKALEQRWRELNDRYEEHCRRVEA